MRFTSVHFDNFKALGDFSIATNHLTVMVGPNNNGKSTVLAAFRMLAEGLRRARTRNPTLVQGPNGKALGYSVSLVDLPVAAENIFHNYNDTRPANIEFQTSHEHKKLVLHFPEIGTCNLILLTPSKIKSTRDFAREFDISVGYVPILGPVEPEEQLHLKDSVRQALLTHRAARNFRNIWHYYPEYFSDFQSLVRESWPGMDIEPPEIDTSRDGNFLHMFCREGRVPRELFWAGFGFQVWCQTLTYMVQNKHASLFILDEPDIYLHPDLQRRLVRLLSTLGPDILLATHSNEITSEVEPEHLVLVDKTRRAAERLQSPKQAGAAYSLLGNQLNSCLVQLAKTRRLLLIDPYAYKIISLLAAKLSTPRVANASHFAVVTAPTLDKSSIEQLVADLEAAIGHTIQLGIVVGMDEKHVLQELTTTLGTKLCVARALQKRSLDNYVLLPHAIKRAVQLSFNQMRLHGDESPSLGLEQLTYFDDFFARSEAMTTEPTAQPTSDRRSTRSKNSTSSRSNARMLAPPVKGSHLGSELLDKVNERLSSNFSLSLSPLQIAKWLQTNEIDPEIVDLIRCLNTFTMTSPNPKPPLPP